MHHKKKWLLGDKSPTKPQQLLMMIGVAEKAKSYFQRQRTNTKLHITTKKKARNG